MAAREAQLASLLVELRRSQVIHDAGTKISGAANASGATTVEVENKDEASHSFFGVSLLQGTGFAVVTDALTRITKTNALLWLELALVLCAGCSAFIYREALAKVSSGALSGDQQVPSSSSKLTGLMRELGVSDFIVEVSEMQLGNMDVLKLDDEVCVQIGIGWNRPVQTRIMPLQKGNRAGMVSFKEVFHLGISKIDGPCVLSVFDREGLHSGADAIARVRVPARALVKMAQQRQEFYRFDIEPAASAERDETKWRPYIAMRIRDQSDKATVAGSLNIPSSSSSQRKR